MCCSIVCTCSLLHRKMQRGQEKYVEITEVEQWSICDVSERKPALVAMSEILVGSEKERSSAVFTAAQKNLLPY